MMKKTSRLAKILICVMMTLCVLPVTAACNTVKLDPTKTLYIGNMNGGVGAAWLNALEKGFEAENPGIDVLVTNKREEYMGDTFVTSIAQNDEVLYFLTEASYEQLSDKSLLEDITDVVTAPIVLSDGTVEPSIEEKMDESLRPYFKRKASTDTEAKYYGIPFFTAVYGIVYDRDLFEIKGLIENAEGTKLGYDHSKIGDGYAPNVGADFVLGTADDGLPATWEDFKILMRVMQSKGVTPFTWAGQGYEYYRRAFERALWASYEGYNDFMLNYTFNGTDSQFGTINNDNGYLLQGQDGKKAVLQASRDIASNVNNYAKSVFNTSQSHLYTHKQFISSRFDSKNNPIGMMLEGSWWENETRDNKDFDNMAEVFPPEQVGYGKRNFALMPMPHFIGTAGVTDEPMEKVLGERTIYSDGNTMAFVSSSALDEQKVLAAKFLQYSTRQSSLEQFTSITGVQRPFDYTISDEMKKAMTPFSLSVDEAFSAPKTKLTTSYNINPIRFLNSGMFDAWDFGSKVEGDPTDPLQYYSPLGGDTSGHSSVTVDSYFKGLAKKFPKEEWDKFARA